MSIYDDLAHEYGQPYPEPPRYPDPYRDPATQLLGAYGPPPARQPPRPPRPSAGPPPRPVGPADLARLHRHLDEVAGTLHTRITLMEARIMSALDNLVAQVANVSQVVTDTVQPALSELAEKARAQGSGISESDVQAQADQLSTLASGLAQAVANARDAAQPGGGAPVAGTFSG